MSQLAYFPSITSIRDPKLIPEIESWLEKNALLTADQAQMIRIALPLEIPMGLPSEGDVDHFVAGLLELGCEIKIQQKEMDEPKSSSVEEDPVAEDLLEEEEPEQSEQPDDPLPAPEVDEPVIEKSATKKPAWIWALIPLLLLLASVTWWAVQQEEPAASGQPEGVVDELLLKVRSAAFSGMSREETVANVERTIQEQNLTPEERKQHSSAYMMEVEGEKPVLNRVVRNRNITIIRASLTFYNKNEKAWKRLAAEYQAIGANLMVDEVRREVAEIFGEERAAEIIPLDEPS